MSYMKFIFPLMDFFPFKLEKPHSYSSPRVKAKGSQVGGSHQMGLFTPECNVLESPSLNASVFKFKLRREEDMTQLFLAFTCNTFLSRCNYSNVVSSLVRSLQVVSIVFQDSYVYPAGLNHNPMVSVVICISLESK